MTGARTVDRRRAGGPHPRARRSAPRARTLAVLLAATLAAACTRPADTAPPPPPIDAQADATGFFCGMRLADHPGPKGQVHPGDAGPPLWFSSVRDTIAYTRMPDAPRRIAAIYVSDMTKSADGLQPPPGAWVDARAAWFVIDSPLRGGMGAPEAMPFSDRAAADAFAARHRGRVVRLADIPDAWALGAVDLQHGAAAGASASPSR